MSEGKEVLRTLITLKVMAQFLQDTGKHPRPRDLLSPGFTIRAEWERLGIHKEYPHQMHLPHLYAAFWDLKGLGLIDDVGDGRVDRNVPQFQLSERGVQAAAMLGNDWRQWKTPEELANAV